MASWAGRVGAGEARLVALIGELDERGAWGGVGVLSCAHWLSWRCAMGPGAARERVRVAAVLRTLPTVAARFGEGALTWTQVRAITRVCTPDQQQLWLDLASACTAPSSNGSSKPSADPKPPSRTRPTRSKPQPDVAPQSGPAPTAGMP